MNDLYIDALQVPIHGRGVMSFANMSTTPNCIRIDEFDQINSRVWYKLSEELRPKEDGTLYEITISYNNGSVLAKMPPPIPLGERKTYDINIGLWPGTILCPESRIGINLGYLHHSRIINSNSSNKEESVDEFTESGLQTASNNQVDQIVQKKLKYCNLLYKEKRKILLDILKDFKRTVIENCYDCGLEDIHAKLSIAVKNMKKALEATTLI